MSDLLLAWEERHERGEDIPAADLCPGRPDLVPLLAARIDLLRRVAWVTDTGTPDPNPNDPPARVHGPLAGRYRLDALIGEGGFGQVWRGFDLELRRPVAVKLPRPGRRHPDSEDAILAEARKVAGLACPGVVPVYDVGRHDGTTFIVSELIDGTDLSRRLRHGRLPVREAVRVVAAAARHLHQAHRQGSVHRDVKPANILLATDGRVLVTDFGIAVPADDPGGAADGAGTLGYMAPEQLFPDRSRVDARTDTYALGVVLYQAVTGQPPFPATSPGILRHQILNTEPPPPRTVDRAIPPEIDRIIMRCLAKSPANRYPTAEALADDLSRWLRRGWVGRLAGWMTRPFSGSRPPGRATGPLMGSGADDGRVFSATGAVRGDGSPRPSKRWEILLAFGGLFGAVVLAGMWYAFRGEAVSSDPTTDEGRPPEPMLGDEVRLFNARDLTGWTFHTKAKALRVEDAVRVRGDSLALGHQKFYRLCTAEKFKDFVLRLEYRYPPGGVVSNAGGAVLLRVAAPERLAQYHLNVKLDRRTGGTVRLPGTQPAAGEDEADARLTAAPGGDWNELEVRCVGPTVTVVLNGRPAGHATGAPQEAGYIGLASQTSDVEFRNIRLQPVR